MKRLYVIYDSVARECNTPFMANNDGVAMRAFGRALAEVPVDQQVEFKLFEVGAIDQEEPRIMARARREVVAALTEEQMDFEEEAVAEE